MLTITDGGSLSRALSSSIDPHIKRLLIQRRNQLGGEIRDIVRFLVAERNDTLATIQEALGYPVLEDTDCRLSCEWAEDHGQVVELVWNLTDDFTHVVLIPIAAGMESELLRLCAEASTVQA